MNNWDFTFTDTDGEPMRFEITGSYTSTYHWCPTCNEPWAQGSSNGGPWEPAACPGCGEPPAAKTMLVQEVALDANIHAE